MKKFRKLTSVISVILCISILFSSSVFAIDGNNNANILSEMCEKYGFKDVDVSEVPEGVIPLKIETPSQLEDYVNGVYLIVDGVIKIGSDSFSMSHVVYISDYIGGLI